LPAGRGVPGLVPPTESSPCLYLENGERYNVGLNVTQTGNRSRAIDWSGPAPHTRGQKSPYSKLMFYALRGHLRRRQPSHGHGVCLTCSLDKNLVNIACSSGDSLADKHKTNRPTPPCGQKISIDSNEVDGRAPAPSSNDIAQHDGNKNALYTGLHNNHDISEFRSGWSCSRYARRGICLSLNLPSLSCTPFDGEAAAPLRCH